MNSKVCGVITGRDLTTVKVMIEKAEKADADLIEVRFDYAQKQYSPFKVRDTTSLPLIGTNRRLLKDGYQRSKERLQSLLSAAEAGFEYIDIELHTQDLKKIVEALKEKGTKPIISHHNYKSMPSPLSLSKVLEEERTAGAEICKLVGTARNFKDNLTPLSFLSEASKKVNIISFCMGKYGIPSRLLAPLFGSSFTYASVSRGKESALGQLTVREMKKIYNTLR